MPPSVIFPSGQRTRGSILQRNRDGSIREGMSGSTPPGQRDTEVSIEDDKLYYFFLRQPLSRRTRFRLCLRCSPQSVRRLRCITRHTRGRCCLLAYRGTETHGKPEVIAVHPGVITTNLMGVTGIGKSIMNAVLLTTKAGAQASIFAASCPSSEIPEDTL